MIRRPPRSTLFPTRRSSDLSDRHADDAKTATVAPTGPAFVLALPCVLGHVAVRVAARRRDRKSTRLNSSHSQISYAVFCLKKKKHAVTEYTFVDTSYRFPAG